MYYIQSCFFYFRWRCRWRVSEVVVNQTNNRGCQFDVHFIQCQTFTEILGIMNELILNVQNCFQFVFTPI